MRTVVTAARLVGPNEVLDAPVLVIEDGRLAQVATRAESELPAGEHVDLPGATLAPAYLDVHVHGCCGHDCMAGTPEAVTAIGSFMAGHGVGAWLPTTITAPKDTTLRSLAALAARIAAPPAPGVARALGIHIEGPFLAPARKGAHPEHHLLAPTVPFFEAMWEASQGALRLMTIAPELPGALEVIARALELGVRVSLGHSNATYAEAASALELGAHSATHTFNAMRPFEQREPGVLGLVLSQPRLYAELICDGLHVHPAAVRMFWSSKGPERAILVTDAMAATGMPDGVYQLGELEVRLEGGRCLLGRGTLAGSTLTLDAGVRRFAEYTGCGVEAAARLAGRNPARMLGLDGVGELRAGGAADLVALSPAGEIQASWVGVRVV